MKAKPKRSFSTYFVKTSKTHLSPLSVFLNFGFFFLYVPFYTKWDPKTQQYIIKRFKLQRLLCGVMFILFCHFYIFNIVNHLNLYKGRQDSYVRCGFDFVNVVGNLCLFIHYFKQVWEKNNSRVRTLLDNCHSFSQNPLLSGIFSFGLLIGFTSILYLNYCTALEASYNNSLQSIEDPTMYLTLGKLIYQQPLLKPVWLFVQAHGTTFYFVAHGHLFAISYEIFGLSTDFKLQIGLLKKFNPEVGLMLYIALKKKVGVINVLVGAQFLGLFLSFFGYTCEITDYFDNYYFQESVWSVAIFLGMNTLTLIGVAEFHHNVCESFGNWYTSFADNQYNIHQSTFVLAQNELLLNSACISCRCFNVTYSFLCSVSCKYYMNRPYTVHVFSPE